MIEFWNVAAEKPPHRADASADGTLPTRAFRYCEAVRLAASEGFYVYSMTTFALRLDEDGRVSALAGDTDEWTTLDERGVHLPGASEAWDAACPEDLRGKCPPSLTALREPGHVQMWTGMLVRHFAADRWRLRVRAPANLPLPPGTWFYEGVVNAYSARPLFTNLRLTRTGDPVVLHADRPLLQVSMAPMASFAPWDYHLSGLDETTPWQDYRETTVASSQGGRVGDYAREERRR